MFDIGTFDYLTFDQGPLSQESSVSQERVDGGSKRRDELRHALHALEESIFLRRLYARKPDEPQAAQTPSIAQPKKIEQEIIQDQAFVDHASHELESISKGIADLSSALKRVELLELERQRAAIEKQVHEIIRQAEAAAKRRADEDALAAILMVI